MKDVVKEIISISILMDRQNKSPFSRTVVQSYFFKPNRTSYRIFDPRDQDYLYYQTSGFRPYTKRTFV